MTDKGKECKKSAPWPLQNIERPPHRALSVNAAAPCRHFILFSLLFLLHFLLSGICQPGALSADCSAGNILHPDLDQPGTAVPGDVLPVDLQVGPVKLDLV